jgi:hypothetical protein
MLLRDRAVSACCRAALLAMAVSAALAVAPPPALAAEALLYRIFLQDGSTLVSYGDFARVADRVVFSIPIGGLDTSSPTLHLVSIAESAVDWERTDGYAQATRARHYASTQGEADFDALSAEVALALHSVSLTKDPERRLAIATDASRKLAAWPTAHHGYRASDVAQLSALLDEAVAELRVAAGLPRVDLTLVATGGPLPANVPELPPPTLRESIEQAFTAASVTEDPTERVSLLQAIVSGLSAEGKTEAPAEGRAEGKLSWTSALHARASAALSQELKTDKSYGDLVARTVTSADERARRADVGGIEKLVRAVLKADDRLGRRRPQTTAALLATLDGRLDTARRLRLARDAWEMRREGLTSYQRRIRPAVERLRRSAAGLEQIRQLSGPSPEALTPLAARLTEAWREMKNIRPPAEAASVHNLLVSALQLAIRAASSRRLAITGTDMNTAWEASAAAAGALLMSERAQEDIRKLATPPGL